MLAHVRAAAYDSKAVLVDENCHPFSFDETPWILAQNGDLPNWMLLQRELLQHCEDRYLKQMRGTTDTEFLYVLLLSLLEGDSDEDVQRAVEEMVRLIAQAMKDLDLACPDQAEDGPGVAEPHHRGQRRSRAPGRDQPGRGLEGAARVRPGHERLRPLDAPGADVPADGSQLPAATRRPTTSRCATEEEATAAIFASEPLTEDDDGWSHLEFGEIVFLHNEGEHVTRTVNKLQAREQ